MLSEGERGKEREGEKESGRGRESELTGGTEKDSLEVLSAQVGLLVKNLRCFHSGNDGVSYLNYRHQQGGRRELG